MDDLVILFSGVDNINNLARRTFQISLVPYLASAFGIERRLIEDQLIQLALFLALHLSVAGDLYLGFKMVVANKAFIFFIRNDLPVSGGHLGRDRKSVV